MRSPSLLRNWHGVKKQQNLSHTLKADSINLLKVLFTTKLSVGSCQILRGRHICRPMISILEYTLSTFLDIPRRKRWRACIVKTDFVLFFDDMFVSENNEWNGPSSLKIYKSKTALIGLMFIPPLASFRVFTRLSNSGKWLSHLL